MEPLKARPAYVTFETKAVEDRQAGIDAGRPVFRDVDYAYVTPAGSRDRIIKIAAEWVAALPQQVRAGMLPKEWADAYTQAYKSFKEGKDEPVDGVSVKNWPQLTPAQVQLLLNLNVRTVEDLAVANEETMNRIGMGARALKEKAQIYLAAAAGPGKVTEELAALKIENARLAGQNESLAEQVRDLRQAVETIRKPGPMEKAAGTPLNADDLIES